MTTPRTAVVTGAAGTLGREIVAALIADGMGVVALDIDDAALAALEDQCGPEVSTANVDMADPDAMEAACRAIEAEQDGVDVLINNVGIISTNKMLTTTLAEMRKVMTLNLESAFLMTQFLLPGMVERGYGRIVNLASFAGRSGGVKAGTAYSISKAAMIGLTLSTAREFAATGVTANAVAPAFVRSPMMSASFATRAEEDAFTDTIPVKRWCEPDEVAHAVAFLASERSGFITGEVLDINGGIQCD